MGKKNNKIEKKIIKPRTIKEALEERLTLDELKFLPRGFDTVGTIAIFSDFPDELIKKEKIVGEALLSIYSHIKTVCKKTKQYSGKFRTPKLKIIAGKRTKETIHVENGVRLKLHVEKVYFSTRSGTERKRIAGLVKPGEDVLVMFSGCGPFVFCISKNTKANSVVGIEINPTAHKYALENIVLNKAKNTTLMCGDVNVVIPKLEKKFDRILMPLPKSAEDFLFAAFMAAKDGAIIHLYDFADEKVIPSQTVEKIDMACKKFNKKYKILSHVKCGQYSPGSYRVCVDFVIDQ